MTRSRLAPFGAGLLFAIGLGVSGMTAPAKVLGFLDITSPRWDPSLLFVMVGAIGTHLLFARWAIRQKARGRRPVLGESFAFPERTSVDGALLVGAALFGLGWGIAGYCPGPAIVSAIASAKASFFVVAMVFGMWAARRSP